jgi:hypothetical protein
MNGSGIRRFKMVSPPAAPLSQAFIGEWERYSIVISPER